MEGRAVPPPCHRLPYAGPGGALLGRDSEVRSRFGSPRRSWSVTLACERKWGIVSWSESLRQELRPAPGSR